MTRPFLISQTMSNRAAADFDPRHQGARYKNVRPKPAASLILIKTFADEAPRFLLGQRAASLAFLPGYFVFPGGRLERKDRHVTAAQPISADKIGPNAARLAACALRELTEETGLSLPSNEQLSYVARAITPPGHIRRYDTRFFARVVGPDFGPSHQIVPQDDELSPIGWFSRRDIEPDKIHFITNLVLDEVEKRLALAPSLENVTLPVPCYRFRYGKAIVEHA